MSNDFFNKNLEISNAHSAVVAPYIGIKPKNIYGLVKLCAVKTMEPKLTAIKPCCPWFIRGDGVENSGTLVASMIFVASYRGDPLTSAAKIFSL